MTDEKQDGRQFRMGRVKENRATRLTRIVWDSLDVILSPKLPSHDWSQYAPRHKRARQTGQVQGG
jgi:hypothetical protein